MNKKDELELTILMPCLNEEATLETCIKKAKKSIEENKIKGEVLIADNGSTDNSIEIAKKNGARVINVPVKGYGSALIEGTKQAYGKYVIMGDADDSYDFSNIMPYVEKLREGYDLVMGNRYKGGIDKDAMPWSHKYIGTPVISFLGRLFYKSKIGDFNCGMRGFNREAILNLDLRCTGMEYASEMIVQANLNNLKIAEIPTTLKKDGRTRPPHLRTFSDGWRHLKFLLTYSPKWLFLYPGLIIILIAIIGFIVAFVNDGNMTIGLLPEILCGGLIVLGLQMLFFFYIAKTYAINSGMNPKNDKFDKIKKIITMEKGIVLGFIIGIIGIIISIYSIINRDETLNMAILGIYGIIIGIQLVFSSFLLGIINIKSKK